MADKANPRTLTLRELNRATLARQLLLGRANSSIMAVVEQVAGLQAQVPNPPYIGLWTRLQDFKRDDLTALMEQRQIVRATLMRSTIHLVTAEDYFLFRPALQPALTRALNAFFGKRAQGLDIPAIVTAAKTALADQPRTFIELRAVLSELAPERDPEALAYVVRTHLPLVQVPPAGTWGYGGNMAYALTENWLGKACETVKAENLRLLALRYLRAFGPATVMDFQAWSGLVKLKDVLDELKPELQIFRDESGRELLDLPDAPLPTADITAPPCFLPEYDNLILSHADRSRVMPDEHRSKVFLSAGRVRSTFLLDGFVAGTWKIEKNKNSAKLIIEPFKPLTDEEKAALDVEGQLLIRFVEDRAENYAVEFSTLHFQPTGA